MGGRGGPALQKGGTSAAPAASSSLNDRVRDVYSALVQSSGEDLVSLSEIRSRIPDASHADLDRVFRDLDSGREAMLVPESKQSLLTQADRDAAVNVGGEAKHLLRISRRS